METNGKPLAYWTEIVDRGVETYTTAHDFMRAILRGGIEDYLGSNRKRAIAAQEWMFSDAPEEWGVSFVDCCGFLRIDPGHVRRKAKALRRGELPTPSHLRAGGMRL